MIEDKPFFNYSGPLYLSFLQKGDKEFDWQGLKNKNTSGQTIIPAAALKQSVVEAYDGVITGSKWHRSIIMASQSHWRPKEGKTVGGGADPINNWNANSTNSQWELVSPTDATGSYPIQAYGTYTQIATQHVDSGVPFTGSFLPSKAIFGVSAKSGSNVNVTASYITDVKITKTDPTNTLPFSIQYRTGSTEFEDWWNSISASAVTYDDNNIHSIHSNLPLLYQNKVQEADLLNLFQC